MRFKELILAFTQFKTLAEVVKTYQLHFTKADFQFRLTQSAPVILKEDLRFTFDYIACDVSEAAICENLIYPVLKAAWKPYADILALWSHQAIEYNETLSGIPDYLISKRSELGLIVLESPYLAVVEAKKDDFTGGWAQCGLEMYTMQQMNNDEKLPVYGIVSNGKIWEISKLVGTQFTSYKPRFDIEELDTLYSALISLLENYKPV
jgi:hypothetical protein